MTNPTENTQSEIGLHEIIEFIKKYGKKTVVFAVISLAVTLFVLAVIYLLSPKKVSYNKEISLQLHRVRGRMVYPSGRGFAASDILSPAVLRQVYNNNQLQDKIEFEKFCKLFHFVTTDVKKAIAASTFKSKLDDKKISVIDQKTIETEYIETLRNMENNTITLAMTPHYKLTDSEEVKILNEVPSVWFQLYSKQEAKQFPRVATVAQLQVLRSSLAGEGWFVVLDKSRLASRNLLRACRQLESVLAGQKVALPSGEFLGDLIDRLSLLDSHRIKPLLLMVQEVPAYKTNFDQVFLRTKIMDLEKAIKATQAKYEANLDAINILQAKEIATGGKSMAENASPITINLDSNFFTSITTLIRNSQSLHLREQYASNALGLKEHIADLESELDYYKEMLDHGKRRDNNAVIPPEQFKKLQDSLFNELVNVCQKVNEFRELIYKDYMLDKQFYTSNSEVLKVADFYIPIKHIAVLLVLIWMLLNAFRCGKDFYIAYTSGELKK